MVNDGRMPAQTPYWESVSVPGIYFAGNVMGASAGLRKHGATSAAGSVNGCPDNTHYFNSLAAMNDKMVVTVKCQPATRVGMLSATVTLSAHWRPSSKQ